MEHNFLQPWSGLRYAIFLCVRNRKTLIVYIDRIYGVRKKKSLYKKNGTFYRFRGIIYQITNNLKGVLFIIKKINLHKNKK